MLRLSALSRIAVVALTLMVTTANATAATTTTTAATSPFAPMPKPAESFDVGTLRIDKFGSGARSLVLIPGLASGSWVWNGTIEKFAPKYTLYVITLPGFDGRPATKEKPLFTIFARDFWELLEKRKIAKPVVIGHSLGGTLAIALAEEHPERLSAIIAADGLPVFPLLANATAADRKATADAIAAQSASQSPAQTLESQKTFMSTIGTNRPELIEPTAKLLAKSDPKAIAAWMHEDLTNDLRPKLNQITIPLLELMPYAPPAAGQPAAYTQEQTLAFYQSLLAGAPKATVVAITPAKHFVMLDQPEPFYAAIAKWLSSIDH